MKIIFQLNTIQSALTLLLIVFLSGCQLMDKSYDLMQDIGLKEEPTLNEKIAQSIALLENGKADDALLLINDVLRVKSDHKTAVILKNQITMSANEFFKTKRHSSYLVKKGDSLGLIADKLLKNSLYFVSLAKLNDIKNPSQLTSGQKIKIPMTAKSDAVVKERIRSAANLKLLDQYYSQKNFLKGLNKANSLFIIKQHMDGLLDRQEKLLSGLEQSIATLDARQQVILQAKNLLTTGRNAAQKKRYQIFIDRHQQQLLLEQAIAEFDQALYLESANKLIKSKSYNETILKQKNYQQLETALVNKLHEQAIIYYRNHVLDKALSHWQLIQQLQPDSVLANKYIVRTEKLIKKLGEF